MPPVRDPAQKTPGTMPPSFYRIVAAQFLSALADNALLIVAIALLQRTGQPAAWVPLLRFFFIIAYVVLAPFVGALADAVPKARLMAWMNGLKWLGALALALGLHPLLAFSIIGIGGSAYAPAKYGLITEMVGPRQLVAANAWIEVTVVGAVLLGTATGGYLVSGLFESTAFALAIAAWAAERGLATSVLAPALLIILLTYGASSLINWRIRCAVPRMVALHLPVLGREFMAAHWTLWRDRAGGRLSLAVTTLFWGASAVLQFAVLRWATERLGLSLAAAAYLQAAVAVGLIVGATVAGRHVTLANAPRMLSGGVLLGALVALGPWLDDPWSATALLLAVGAVGGVLMVPMNALLQHRGYELLTPGRSIAVQGFNENASVLVMLAVYAWTVSLEVPIEPLMTGFGLVVAASMALIAWRFRRLAGQRSQAHAHPS
jgi:LPLT family lysophospholipid transporter-like MFS transporter